MFTHPQQHQRLWQQEAFNAQSMAQSSTDLSALPVFGVDPLQANPNLFGSFDQYDDLGMNALHSQVGGAQNWGDPSKPRKRGREEDQEEEDDMAASTSAKSRLLLMGNRQHPLWAPSRAAPPPLYPSLCCPEDPDSDLSARMEKDLRELDLFISAQLEKALEEVKQRRRRLWAGVVRTVAGGVQRALKAKDEEIASVAPRNSALEDRINVLAMEGQMWKALAKTSEAAAAALRRDVELAQQTSARGVDAPCGGEAEDSVSCCEGRRGEEEEGVGGEGGGSPRRRCRLCRRGEVSRLALPCRHLCLCGTCDSATESCPVCGCQKRASVKVYLS